MIKLLILLLLHVSVGMNLYATVYDTDTIKIFSKIMPRLVFMSSLKESLSQDDNITLCVVYDTLDEKDANILINTIHSSYPNGLKKHPIHLINTQYNALNKCQNSLITFMFNSNNENIKKGINYTKEHAILSMSYNPKFLEMGIDSSLYLGRKIRPYINVKAIDLKGIKLNPIFIQISKVYTQK